VLSIEAAVIARCDPPSSRCCCSILANGRMHLPDKDVGSLCADSEADIYHGCLDIE
jgi:hypothetical protein